MILNDMYFICIRIFNLCSDPTYFKLTPLDRSFLSDEDALENLKNIIRAIVHYYDKTRGWELESNISLSSIFLKFVILRFSHIAMIQNR